MWITKQQQKCGQSLSNPTDFSPLFPFKFLLCYVPLSSSYCTEVKLAKWYPSKLKAQWLILALARKCNWFKIWFFAVWNIFLEIFQVLHHSEFLFSLLYNGTQLYLLVFINWHSCWSGKIDQKSLQCTIFIRFPSLFCHYYDSSFMAICSLYMYGIMKKICHHSKSLRIVNPLLIRSWLLIFKPQATAR